MVVSSDLQHADFRVLEPDVVRLRADLSATTRSGSNLDHHSPWKRLGNSILNPTKSIISLTFREQLRRIFDTLLMHNSDLFGSLREILPGPSQLLKNERLGGCFSLFFPP